MTRKDAKDKKTWTNAELIAIIAIRNIELKMEPKCDGCGTGADRPNCAMGGGCGRHEQEDVMAYHSVIRTIERAAGLDQLWGWRQHYPLNEVWKLSEENRALMLDLYEEVVIDGRKHETRKYDDRFRKLSAIGAVSHSAQYDKWKVSFTTRGEAWAKELYESHTAQQIAAIEGQEQFLREDGDDRPGILPERN